MYILSMQICKIHRYETFVNVFVFSLNRLTPGRGVGGGGGEFDCLQPCNIDIHAAFYRK